MISTIIEKKYEEFVFKKKDLEIVSDDETRYFVNPEKDVCLYDTISPGWGRRRILHAQNKKSWHTILYLRDGSAKFDGVNKEHIEQALKDEELEHDTVLHESS